jgi:hypothetical protein
VLSGSLRSVELSTGLNREALEGRKRLLLLGASDMEQVIAAAVALEAQEESETPNFALTRALETAVAVCYWRPFSQRNTMGHLQKSDAEDSQLHALMETFRNQVYAHTDTSSGRTAEIGLHGMILSEAWWAPVDNHLPAIIEAATRQRDPMACRGREDQCPSFRVAAVRVRQPRHGTRSRPGAGSASWSPYWRGRPSP